MSYEAPTPPPSSPTPPTGGNVTVNTSMWNRFDFIALGAGVLFFIFSLFNGFIHVSVNGFGSGTHYTSWHSWGWLGTLLILAAAIAVGAKALGDAVPATVPLPLIAAGAAGAGWLLLALRAFTYSAGSLGCPVGCNGISVSPGWSAWVLLLIGLVLAAATIIPLTSYRSRVEAKLNNLGGGSGA